MARQLGLPVTEEDWTGLVGARRRQLARFLSWAAVREIGDSLRLSNRGDVRRVQAILDAFAEPWWAAVVYTCFDSEVGTLAVAQAFPHPVDSAEATRRLLRIDLPVGAVRHHRTQPGHVGAKTALVSACGSAHDFERILREKGGASTTATRRCVDYGLSSGVARPALTFWFAPASSGSGARGNTIPTARILRTRPALARGSV